MFVKQLSCLVLLAAFSSVALSNQEGTSLAQVNVDVGYENGVFTPRGTLPVNWNKKFSSSISYVGKQTISIDALDGFEDSLNASRSQERRISLNALTYEFNPSDNPDATVSIGLTYEQLKVEADEKGFIALGTDAYRTELSRKIEVDRINIPLTYQLTTGHFVNRLNTTVTAYSSLSLDQDLYLPLLNTERQLLTDSQTQAIAYQVSLEGVYKGLGDVFAPGWRFTYESLPLEYKTLMANVTGNVSTEDIKHTTNTLTLEGRIYFGLTSGKSTAKYFGVRREIATSSFEVAGTKIPNEHMYLTSIVLGVDGRF